MQEEVFKNILLTNILKLQKVRYKNGFTEEDAIDRDLEAEMVELKR